MFTNWDSDTYEHELIVTALDFPKMLTNIAKGHTLEYHANQTDMQLIGRIMRENKQIASTFADTEDYPVLSMIGDAIANKSSEVTDWIMSKRSEFATHSDYELFVINLDLGQDEPIGFGFKPDLQKYATDTITVVLRRDNSGENQFGFFVLTAYPDVEKGYPINVKYKANELLEETNLSVIEKMKLSIKEMPVQCKIDIDNFTEKQELSILFKEKTGEQYMAFMDEEKLRIKSYTKGLTKTISKEELKSLSPTLFTAIDRAELYRDFAITLREKQNNLLVQKTCKEDKETLKLKHKRNEITK